MGDRSRRSPGFSRDSSRCPKQVEGGDVAWEEEMKRVFGLLANEKGLMDGLGLCSALALLSPGPLSARVHECVAAYDVPRAPELPTGALGI